MVYQQEQAARQLQDLNNLMAVSDSLAQAITDSASMAVRRDAFGGFSASAFGEEEFYTLENELLKLVLSSKGGRVYSAELKKYKAQEGKPLILFEDEESDFNYVLVTDNNRVVNTSELYFEPQGEIVKTADGAQTLTMRLKTTEENAYIDFIYTLPANDYMVRYEVKLIIWMK